jgi:hypothetical protein
VKHALWNREFGEIRTVIVLGVGRGGTSLVAGCLRALGVCMGVAPHPLKHEWSPIVYLADGKIDVAATYRTIQQMDRDYSPWGWKSPRDVFQLEQILPLLRDPGFVFVTRDLLEPSLSGLSYQDVPLYISLDETATVYRAITSRLRFWPWPALIVPFAEALQQPKSLVSLLCSFLKLEADREAVVHATDFIQPGTNAYRLFDAKPGDPPHITSAEDLRADSEALATHLSNRYAQEYFQELESILIKAKLTGRKVSSQISYANKLGLLDDLADQLARAYSLLPVNRLRAWLLHARIKRAKTDAKLQASLNWLLEQLSTAANEAKEHVRTRSADSGYHALTQIYRVLQVVIRVRNALQRALHLTGLNTPMQAPFTDSDGKEQIEN